MIFSHVKIPPRVFWIFRNWSWPRNDFFIRCASKCETIPALLHTSQESRQYSLTLYKPLSQSPELYIDLSRDVLCFADFSVVEGFLNQLSNKTTTDPIITPREIYSKQAHILLDSPTHDHEDLRQLPLFTGLQSVTLHDVFSIYQDKDEMENWKLSARTEWKKIWVGKVEPKLFFATPSETKQMKWNGDTTWLQIKLAQVAADESVVQQ